MYLEHKLLRQPQGVGWTLVTLQLGDFPLSGQAGQQATELWDAEGGCEGALAWQLLHCKPVWCPYP